MCLMTKRNEWVERNVNGKVVLCAEGGFTVRRMIVCTHNFPTLVFCRFLLTLLLLLLFFVYLFMSTLTYHHPFCVFSSLAHRTCIGELEKLSSRYSSNMYGFTLTEHVENIINFISLRFSFHNTFSSPILATEPH